MNHFPPKALEEFLEGLGMSGPTALPLFVLLVIAAFLAVATFFVGLNERAERRRSNRGRNVVPFSRVRKSRRNYRPNMADPKDQLEAVSKVAFEKQRLLNKSEYQVLVFLERIVSEMNAGHRVMAQTSLGELIRPREASGHPELRKNGFASINSKRLDFAIIDKNGLLSLAVEFQGSGHYHQTSFMRDAVKREALRKAGVELLEVPDGWQPEEIELRVRNLLQTMKNGFSRAPIK